MTTHRHFGLNNSVRPASGALYRSDATHAGATRGSLPPLPAGSLNYDADARSRERAAGWFFAVVISLVFAIPLILAGVIRHFS